MENFLATLAINPSRKYNPCTFKYLKGWKICELIGDGMQCSKKLKSRKSYPGSDKYLGEILDKFLSKLMISVLSDFWCRALSDPLRMF